eukprot:TRINITY_DN3487_c0_g1_i1.p1 TRINITY_DN3487_c0_g1~~TRINITY_DN3487_c0_g1_i1.p1  ORF type:complete len:199 (-),score=48.54 TRINITY_DN3487_c0_g1_i1:210-806(-)
MQQLVLGDEVLEVQGGFAFDLVLTAFCTDGRTATLTLNPADDGAALHAKLAAALELQAPLSVTLAVSGSLEQPGEVNQVGSDFSMAGLASSFASLLVLAGEQNPVRDVQLSLPLPGLSPIKINIPCTSEHTDSDLSVMASFCLGLAVSGSELDPSGLRLHQDKHQSDAYGCEVEPGSTASAAVETHLQHLKWDFHDDS